MIFFWCVKNRCNLWISNKASRFRFHFNFFACNYPCYKNGKNVKDGRFFWINLISWLEEVCWIRMSFPQRSVYEFLGWLVPRVSLPQKIPHLSCSKKINFFEDSIKTVKNQIKFQSKRDWMPLSSKKTNHILTLHFTQFQGKRKTNFVIDTNSHGIPTRWLPQIKFLIRKKILIWKTEAFFFRSEILIKFCNLM